MNINAKGSFFFCITNTCSLIIAINECVFYPSQQKASPKKSRNSSPTKKRQLKLDQPKPKRPMNAFMLFAKDHREEYTQKFPGKDNR